MKKTTSLLLFLALICTLTGCGCKHEWKDATCETPKICSLCEEVEGEPLGHSWQEATCEAPKTCSGCGLTEGEALGHSWAEATCEAPRTCTNCTMTEGDALGHSWNNADCQEEKVCTVCSFASGETGPHMDVEAVSKEGENDVRLLCKCGQEEVISAEKLMLRLLRGKWNIRLIQKSGDFYLPDPEKYAKEGQWLEFPSAEEPYGYEAGTSDIVAKYVVPQELVEFRLTTAIMYTGGPELPVLMCSSRSDYGENAYIDKPMFLVLGERGWLPGDSSDEEFLQAAIDGNVLSLFRFDLEGMYVYYYDPA